MMCVDRVVHVAARIAAAAIACGALLAGGCASDPREGYSATNPYASNIKSVAVEIFQNRSYVRSMEFDLAEALTKKIPVSTPYRILSANTADTILRGTITDIKLTQLSADPTTGLANEMMFKVTVDFEWSDLKTGRPIVARSGFVASALFVPSRGAQEPIELGRFEAAQQLAQDLVDQMQSAW